MRDRELEARLQDALDAGHAVWLIGDVHGHRETLEALISKLDMTEDDLILCMGDLIDRGPDSLGVLRLVEGSENIHSIRGNHEETLRLSVSPKHGKMMKSWLKYGGEDTLRSFSDDPDEQIDIAREWLPFIESLPTELVLRDHRLVHGGYDIGKTLEEQNNRDRMWSRSIFSSEVATDPRRQVIVGHTTVQALSRDIDGVWDSELEERVLDSGIWASEIPLDDGRASLLAIDTGIYLPDDELPRITALNLLTGEVVSQSRAEAPGESD